VVIILNKSGAKAIEYMLELVKQGKLVITDEGRIYKVDGEGNLYNGETLTGYGYYRVDVYLGNYKYLNCFSHRLIYAYHHGLESLKEGNVIHHIDHNKTNNHISNLAQIPKQLNSCIGDGATKKSKKVKKSLVF
jgi:hypothetical protein